MVNLSEVEKFYIEGHREVCYTEKAARILSKSIAKDMRGAVTPEIVQAYLESLPPEPEEEPVVQTAIDLMAVDKDKGVAIMTEAASERSDEVRDKQSDQDYVKKNSGKIHRIQ